jgi:hypothetical protein
MIRPVANLQNISKAQDFALKPSPKAVLHGQ